ncbi:MAG TPA: protein-L-isoaspartate(D-aspartate) O-methyltransferase [Gemmataceae bacterium]|nr:protein-L-isoaspartate(D-aspartate) O-methyltransferase [Gemmataceae bacterium]
MSRSRAPRLLPLCSAAVVLLAASACTAQDPNWSNLRVRMVERQLKARGIKDERILQAMSKVPRHEFVPERRRVDAYDDGPLPIGHGQTISQPYIVALMTEAIRPKPEHRVLEVGTGSGYQAAVLAELVKDVYTIELVPELADEAKERLKRLGYKNVQTKSGDGYKGWPDAAPFDAIVVTCGADHVPEPLFEQLKPGGVLVIPVGKTRAEQSLLAITKDGKGGRTTRDFGPVVFVPLRRGTEGKDK